MKGVDGEIAAEQGGVAGGGEVGVDRSGDEQRAEDVDAGFEQDGDGRSDDLEGVRGEVTDEPAHDERVVYLADYIVVGSRSFFFGLGVGFLGRHRLSEV